MKNRLVKDSVLILLTNVITYIATIINTRVISSTYTLEHYGYRAQVLSIVAIFVSIFSLGLSNCPNYFIPLAAQGEKYINEKIIRNLYLTAMAVVLGMVLIALIGFDGIVRYYNNDVLYHYKIIIILMVAEQIFYSFYSGIQISQHRAICATITNLVRSILTVIVTIIICSKDGSIYNVVLFTLMVDCVFCIYTFIDSTHPHLKIGKWIDLNLIKEMVKYSVPLGISNVTSGLCTQIDKLFVVRFFSSEDLAVYTNMCTELPLAAVSGAFIAVISPYVVKLISNNKVKQAIELWDYVIELVAIILITIIAGLFTYSYQAVYILYSEKYLEGILLFRIFLLVEITRITYFGLILRSFGKNILILFCSVLTLVMNVILNSIAYYVFHGGLIGFAVATMSSTYIVQILQLKMSCKVAQIRLLEIFPWKRLGCIFAVNLGFIIVFSYLTKYIGLADSLNILKVAPLVLGWAVTYILIMSRRLRTLYNKIRDMKLV